MSEEKPFDYTPYDIDIIDAKTVKGMISIIADSKNASWPELIRSALTLALISAGLFILWRLRSRDYRKHKIDYEKKVINNNKEQIDSDSLD